MKHLLLTALCLLPLGASAASLSVCDHNTYEVTIRNGGASRVATVSARTGQIVEYGPMVSFQIKGQKEVVTHQPSEDYCIWDGRIKLQRYNSFGNSGGGFSLR